MLGEDRFRETDDGKAQKVSELLGSLVYILKEEVALETKPNGRIKGEFETWCHSRTNLLRDPVFHSYHPPTSFQQSTWKNLLRM